MTDRNHDELIPAIPSIAPSEQREKLRAQLLASHSARAVRLPRWAHIAAMVAAGALLMGAGAATKEIVDEIRGQNIAIEQWKVELDSEGKPVDAKQRSGEQGMTLTQVIGLSGGPGFTEADASRNMVSLKSAVDQKKFRFLRTDKRIGEEMFIYALTLPDGTETHFNTSVRLEDVNGWDDLQSKEKARTVQQMQALMLAVSQGKARITADRMFVYHVCKETKTGRAIEVLKTEVAGRPAMATIFESPLGKSPASQSSTWQEHLDTLASGEREFIEIKAIPQFTYTFKAVDGREETRSSSYIKPGK